MTERAFNNYLNEIMNAIDALKNHHDESSRKTFLNNGRWAMRLLEKYFKDKDYNIRRWLNGKPCVFTSDKTGHKMEINIGPSREALYYFLVFCKKIAENQEISNDLREYLALLITRSCFKEWDEC